MEKQSLLFDLEERLTDPYQDLDLVLDDDGYNFHTNGTSINYTNLEKVYFKKHKKIPRAHAAIAKDGNPTKASWMRVDHGEIVIRVENSNPGETVIKVWVKREEDSLTAALRINDGENKIVKSKLEINVPKNRILPISKTEWDIKVDLDSLYSTTEDGYLKEVYALCPSDIEKTNKFQLSTQVFLGVVDYDGNHNVKLIAEKVSEPFLIRTPGRKPAPNLRQWECSSIGSGASWSPESIASIGYTNTEDEPCRKRKFCENRRDLPNAEYNKLIAHEADIKHLKYKYQTTHQRDIGYHVQLSDPNQKGKFEEGDVVVFLDSHDQKTGIELLSSDNYSDAKLAGVITRSYYLEGALPTEDENDITDIVCVIGIVKVRTIGPVINGEHLYAAPTEPGVAVGASHLPLFANSRNSKPLLLGQALESRVDVELNEESLVSSFVSVVLGIERIATAQTVSDLQVKIKENIYSSIERAATKLKFRDILLKLLIIMVFGMIAIALWQRYAPNTLFRKSMCKRGSEGGKLLLTFSTSWQTIDVNFLQFEFETLDKKLFKRIRRCSKGKCGNGTIRYFMNFDRCSNREVTFGNEFVDDTPTVSGPEIIAIDNECSMPSLHYFVDGSWVNFKKKHKRKKARVKCN